MKLCLGAARLSVPGRRRETACGPALDFYQILLIVMALWYSRAALARCYIGAACHMAPGEKEP